MLAAGTVLDAGQLGRLRELGIREVVVVEPAADQAATDPACLAEREQVERAKVEHLFRRSEDDRVTKALFQAVLDHRLGKRE
ncbi:MAG: hypothetical protein KUL75_08740 [Sterolibacterium sp.]|nr:hypothetical protein [Sterolibacterium sp.]